MFNPYQYQYNMQMPQQNMQMQMKQEIIKVSGENGAKAYQLAPNSSCLLLDEMNPIVWLKTTDGAGYPSITPYTITPYQEEKKPDYKTLEQRIAKLEEIINGKSNNADVGEK